MCKRLFLAAIAMVMLGTLGTAADKELTWIADDSIGFVLPEGFVIKEEDKYINVLTHPDFPQCTFMIIGPEKLLGPTQFKDSVHHLIQSFAKGKSYATQEETEDSGGNYEEGFTGIYVIPNAEDPKAIIICTSGRISGYCISVALVADDPDFIQACQPIALSIEVDEEAAAEVATD